MDTIDRPDSNVPARYAGESPRMPVPISAPSRDMAVAPQPSMPQVTPRILIRGLSLTSRSDHDTLDITDRLFDGLYEHTRRQLLTGRPPA